MDIPDTIKQTMAAGIKAGVQTFIDWVKMKAVAMTYPKVNTVPVYLPRLYRYPRKEGRTNQLRKSLTAAFHSRLEPEIYWDTPYASYVLDRGRVRTPGTTARWPEKSRWEFQIWLRYFIKKEIGNAVDQITIHSVADN